MTIEEYFEKKYQTSQEYLARYIPVSILHSNEPNPNGSMFPIGSAAEEADNPYGLTGEEMMKVKMTANIRMPKNASPLQQSIALSRAIVEMQEEKEKLEQERIELEYQMQQEHEEWVEEHPDYELEMYLD